MNRVLLAALVGGLILFVWGAVTHMLTPLGMVGFERLAPDKEAAAIEAIQAGAGENRVYFFPGMDLSDEEGAEKEPYKSRNASGPTGLIVYVPGPGMTADDMGPYLVREFLTNVLQALAMAIVVAMLAPSIGFGGRVWVCTLIGIAAAIGTDASYWIWYHFPGDYFVSQAVQNVSGALLAGLAIAKLARPAP